MNKYLVPENVFAVTGDKIRPRNVMDSHFTKVLPEPVKEPYSIAVSESCAASLGIGLEDTKTQDFTEVFVGNIQLPSLGTPYCTIYGCHSYGTWFGQLGDGRAITIGEISVPLGSDADGTSSDRASGDRVLDSGLRIQELQLKGAGRTPYSRGFDGRAVLRSSVREYLGRQ